MRFPLILAGEMLNSITAILKPRMAEEADEEKLGKVVLGTVQGDIHDIAKDIVVFMLDINGFEVTDLGSGMRFGTRVAFKSVIAAQASALLAWAAADQGDRVGGLVFDEARDFERRPAPVFRDGRFRMNFAQYVEFASAAEVEKFGALAPITPVEWESSTITSASYCSASSTM